MFQISEPGPAAHAGSRSDRPVPAVDHDRPRESGVDGLDLFEELQHADGREGDSKVRPAGEVELGDGSGGLGSIAGLLGTNTQRLQMWRESEKSKECRFLAAQQHKRALKSPKGGRNTYVLDTELAYGVIHEDSEVFNRHPHVPVHPAALIRPVLVTLVLHNTVFH